MLETNNAPQTTQNTEVVAILERMEQTAKSQEKLTRRLCSLLGFCTLASVATVVILVALFLQITPLLAQLSEVAQNLNIAAQHLASLDLAGSVANFDETLRIAQENILAIDVEELNAAIKALYDVVAPLASFFG